MTTITIWIPKSDLENLKRLQIIDGVEDRNFVKDYLDKYPITIYTEKMHTDCLQLNVSLDLFTKLNLQ